MLFALAGLGYAQNMAFTWASRSRNQSDPEHHRWAALTSNSIFFVVSVLIWGQLWQSLTTGEFWKIAITGVVYTISTTEGSVKMMKVLIKKGK
jgi:hypothetical protein